MCGEKIISILSYAPGLLPAFICPKVQKGRGCRIAGAILTLISVGHRKVV
jgi:hypothetical protein